MTNEIGTFLFGAGIGMILALLCYTLGRVNRRKGGKRWVSPLMDHILEPLERR